MTELKRTKRAQRGAGTSKAEATAAKELLFVDYYLGNGCIGAKAYLQAGYKAKNAHVAAVMASRLLRKPDIAQLIKERTQKRLEAARIEADEVILSAACAIRFDPRKLIKNGKVKPVEEWDTESVLAISALELPDGTKVRVDRGGAQERLMKHLGLFKSDNQQKPAGTVVHPPGVRTVVFVEPLTDTRKG
jgi:phage terminase small subunit